MDFISSRNSLTSPDPSLFPQFDSLNEVVHFLNSSLPSEAFSTFEKIRQHGQLCDVTIVVLFLILISMLFARLKENNFFKFITEFHWFRSEIIGLAHIGWFWQPAFLTLLECFFMTWLNREHLLFPYSKSNLRMLSNFFHWKNDFFCYYSWMFLFIYLGQWKLLLTMPMEDE